MKPKKTNQDVLYIRSGYQIRQLIAEVVKLTDDQRIKNQERGWWSHLAIKMLNVYIAHLKAGNA